MNIKERGENELPRMGGAGGVETAQASEVLRLLSERGERKRGRGPCTRRAKTWDAGGDFRRHIEVTMQDGRNILALNGGPLPFNAKEAFRRAFSFPRLGSAGFPKTP